MHPEIEFLGVYDTDERRKRTGAEFFELPMFANFDDVLHDDAVELVLNLTSPDSHFEVTSEALRAGKAVYSEKPLGLTLEESGRLLALSQETQTVLAGAPATVLGRAAQTAWKAIRDGRIGKPHLVLADIHDGIMHQCGLESWVNGVGIEWPTASEFKTGCVLEHAHYHISWCVAFFGSVTRVHSFATTLFDHKCGLDALGPDFGVGVLEFESGIVCRLTNSVVSQVDRTISFVGDAGTIHVDKCWIDDATLTWTQEDRKRIYPVVEQLALIGPELPRYNRNTSFDFLRGVGDALQACRERREPLLTAGFQHHVNEVAIALNRTGITEIRTKAPTLSPLPW